MMGSGKSTVGRALAGGLGWPFVDSDEQVEARTGHTVAELFARFGETYFRSREAEVLAEALGGERPAVIAAAGGTVVDPANRAAIRARAALVVWLRVAPDVLVDRVRGTDHRPLLEADPLGTLRRLDAQRRPLYAEVAGLTIDAGDRSVDSVVEQIMAAVDAGAARR